MNLKIELNLSILLNVENKFRDDELVCSPENVFTSTYNVYYVEHSNCITIVRLHALQYSGVLIAF